MATKQQWPDALSNEAEQMYAQWAARFYSLHAEAEQRRRECEELAQCFEQLNQSALKGADTCVEQLKDLTARVQAYYRAQEGTPAKRPAKQATKHPVQKIRHARKAGV